MLLESYKEAKRKEKDYNKYWRTRGYMVRPNSIPFFFRWIAGKTRRLEPEHQEEMDSRRKEFELTD